MIDRKTKESIAQAIYYHMFPDRPGTFRDDKWLADKYLDCAGCAIEAYEAAKAAEAEQPKCQYCGLALNNGKCLYKTHNNEQPVEEPNYREMYVNLLTEYHKVICETKREICDECEGTGRIMTESIQCFKCHPVDDESRKS